MSTSSNLIPPNAFYGQTTNKGFEYSGEEHPNTLIQDTYTKAQCNGLKGKARHDTSHEFHRNIKYRANSVTRDENMSRVRYHRNGNKLFTDLQLQEKTDNRSPTRGGHRSPVRHHTPLGTNPRRAQPSDMKTSRRSYKRKAMGGDTHPARKHGRCSSSIGHHHTQERTGPMSRRPKPLKLTQPPITCFMLRRVKSTVGRPPNNSWDYSDARIGDDRPNARAPESPIPLLPPATKEKTLQTLSVPETIFVIAILNVMEIYKIDAGRAEHTFWSLLSKELLGLGVDAEDVMSVVSRLSGYKQGMVKMGLSPP